MIDADELRATKPRVDAGEEERAVPNPKQQMRWSEAGARSLLRVRTAVIDGELERLDQAPVPGAANEPVAVPLAA